MTRHALQRRPVVVHGPSTTRPRLRPRSRVRLRRPCMDRPSGVLDGHRPCDKAAPRGTPGALRPRSRLLRVEHRQARHRLPHPPPRPSCQTRARRQGKPPTRPRLLDHPPSETGECRRSVRRGAGGRAARPPRHDFQSGTSLSPLHTWGFAASRASSRPARAYLAGGPRS